MVLQKKIITTITSIIINVISNDVDVSKTKIMERLCFKRFCRKMHKWVREYIQDNDDTILTTSAFMNYYTYQKPVERILNYLYEPSCTVNEHEYVEQLINECRESVVRNAGRYVTEDYFVLKKFFEEVLRRYKEFLYEKLSDDTRVLLFSHRQMEANLGNKIDKVNTSVISTVKEENEDLICRIQAMLPGNYKITDTKLIGDIYSIINAKLWSGNIDEVRSLLPIIDGRSFDLELGIKCSLNIMSDEEMLSVNPWSDVNRIQITSIRDDVIRKLILFNLEDKQKLSMIRGQASGEELNNLISDLVDQGQNTVLEVEVKEDGVFNVYEFKITDKYPSEMWLLKRICLLYLYNENMIIANEMEKLLGEDICFVDKILIDIKKINEVLSRGSDISEDDLALSILKKLVNSKEKVQYMCKDVQKEYFVSVFRATILCSTTDADRMVVGLPEWLKDDVNIQELTMQLKIEKGEAEETEIIERCKLSGAYWLLNNYLIRQEDKVASILKILGYHRWLIDEDFHLFILYAQAVRIEKGNTEGAKLLVEYKGKYQTYIEFWIEMLKISCRDEIVNEFMAVWSSDESIYIFPDSDVTACGLLMQCQRYKEATKIIDKIEALKKTNERVLHMKAEALMFQGYKLEALSVFNTLFSEYTQNERVIDAIIGISIENKRPISDEVLKSAIAIDSSRMLMLSAVVCEESNRHEDAKNLIMRALLKSKESDIDTFRNYLVIQMGDKNDNGPKLEKIDVYTSVILESKENGEKIVYCIYEKNILPEEAFVWERATHISEDYAIQMGLIRKEVGMDITIGEITYSIKEILTLDCYYFRICMNKMVGAGIAKQILIPTGDDEKSRKEMVDILKDNIPDEGNEFKWLDNYQDMNNMTVPLFSLQRFVNVNYLQFIIVLLEDSSVVFRESLNCNEISGDRYILSFATVAALYKLGFPIEQYKNVYITESTQREILSEAEDIIARYKKDCVATMGKTNGELYFQESVEEEKQKWMGEAAGIRQYCQRINTMDNEKDIKVEEFKDFDWKEFLGVCDYDALAIAMNTDMVLVTAEVPIMTISQIKECNISSVGILDFLCDMDLPAKTLINYIRKMIDFRFNIIVTDKVIKKLTELYDVMGEAEQLELLLQWGECLGLINELEEKYRDIFISLITDLFKMYHDESRMDNPIWRCFALYVMRYNNVRLPVYVKEKNS